MINQQNTLVLAAIFPVAVVKNTAFASQVIDTAGASYAEFHVILGATTASATVFKVQEADAKTNATTLTGGTDVKDLTVKPGVTDGSKVWVVGVDLKKPRKRFLQLQVTAGNESGAGMFLAATCELSRLNVAGSSAADRGVADAEYA